MTLQSVYEELALRPFTDSVKPKPKVKAVKPRKNAAPAARLANSKPVLFCIELLGIIPPKKSLYRIGRKGLFLNKEIAAIIDDLKRQATKTWAIIGSGGALVHPSISVKFSVPSSKSASWDRDGALVTILDVLQGAGVLVNDNVKWCNGRITIHEAVLDAPRAITEINLTAA